MSRLIQHSKSPAMTAYLSMIEAMDDHSENELLDIEKIQPTELRTWPSTLSYIDEKCGGFYGLTTFAARKGVGKTMLALGSAIEAAASGNWQVCYFASEDDSDGIAIRFNNYMNAHPHCEKALDNLSIFQSGRGQTPHDLTVQVGAAIDRGIGLPVLTVIDSINSMVEMSRYSYLDGLTQFGLWAMLSRRISRGAASFLLVSETNKRNEIKGEKLPYWSDQVILMEPCEGTSDIIQMTLDKSRRTAGVGPMGKFVRIWDEGKFLSQSEVEEMRGRIRVVNAGSGSRPDEEGLLFE